MTNIQNDNNYVPYEKYVKVLAELAKLKDVSTILIRKIQSHWGVGDYFISELKDLIQILDLPSSIQVSNGINNSNIESQNEEGVTMSNYVTGYFDRLDAINNIKGSVIWDSLNKVWIEQKKA